jgi:hypothetical protein
MRRLCVLLHGGLLQQVLRQVLLIGSVGVSGLGLVWVIANASVVPVYGDTNEYLALARTLRVDQYRTILYPGLLWVCRAAPGDGDPPFPAAVYAVQWGLLVASTAIFAFALASAAGLSRSRRRMSLVLATVVLVGTNPLIAHFALSLLTDSLASSFTMGFVGALALTIDDGVRVRPGRRLWLGITLVYLVLMAWSRVEKLYLGAALVFLTSIWLLRNTRAAGTVTGRRVVLLSGLFAAALGAVVLLNRAAQTPNPNRPPLDLSSLAFNRVVWPRLARVYPYLSPEAQAVVPFEAAVRFDAHNNQVYPFLSDLLQQRPDSRRIIDEITLTTLRTFPLAVLGKTAFDTAKYTLPNLAFPLERAGLFPQSIATAWTVARMASAHPGLTWTVLLAAETFFLIVQLPVALAALLAGRERRLWRHPIFLLTVSTVLTNALLFGLESGIDAHVRYALPAYVMIHAWVAFLSVAWRYDLARTPRVPPHR